MERCSFDTVALQNAVVKAMKGASCNKMLPITSLMGISIHEEYFEITTTDGTNYLYVKGNIRDTDGVFDVVVPADVFAKLISKLTCDVVIFEKEDDRLTVKGNGVYVVELPIDEVGEPITYPDPIGNTKYNDIGNRIDEGVINASTVKQILTTAKPALATTMEIPCYVGYYVADCVIATDTFKICGLDTPIFNKPRLLSSELVDLLAVSDDAQFEYYIFDDAIEFFAYDVMIFGRELDGIDDFQVDVIRGLLNSEFTSSCRINKAKLLRALDRLSLFVESFDRNYINLEFTNDDIILSSKKQSGVEHIAYDSCINPIHFVCTISIEMLQPQVKANVGDVIEIHFGEDNAIKITNDNVTQIVALGEN